MIESYSLGQHGYQRNIAKQSVWRARKLTSSPMTAISVLSFALAAADMSVCCLAEGRASGEVGGRRDRLYERGCVAA